MGASVEGRRAVGPEALPTGSGDHRGVVRAHRPARQEAAQSGVGARDLHLLAQQRVRRDAAAERDPFAPTRRQHGASCSRTRPRLPPGTTRRRRRSTAGCLRTWLTTEVFSPLNLKSRPSLSIARGNTIATGSPLAASRSIAGPPGSRDRGTWPPCRTPRRRHRRSFARAARTARAAHLTSIVCPPDTSSTTNGSSTSGPRAARRRGVPPCGSPRRTGRPRRTPAPLPPTRRPAVRRSVRARRSRDSVDPPFVDARPQRSPGRSPG